MHAGIVLVVIALGVAGFDPFGALIVAACRALGASRRAALAFLATSLIIPLGVAVLAGHLVGPTEAAIRPWLHAPAPAWTVVRILAGIGLMVWATWRLGRPPAEKPLRTPREISAWAMTTAGLGFGATVLLDPAYYAAIAVVAHLHPWLRAGLLVVWFAVAQIALIGLVIVDLIWPRADFGGRLQRLWHRTSPRISRVVTLAALLAGATLVTHGVWELLHLGQ